MPSFSLNMLYWDNGDPIRAENTDFCWQKCKELTLWLTENNIPTKSFLFDFSESTRYSDSVHVPFNSKYYERSKKINYALNYSCNNDIDVFSIIDSDCYFDVSYYEGLKNDIISSFNNNEVLTYQLIDIPLEKRYQFIDFKERTTKYVNINDEINKNNFIYRHSAGFGTMGGFFICNTSKLREVGGFNENFLTWGGEDDEVLQRLKGKQSWRPRHNQGPVHLCHPKNLKDPYYHIDVYSDAWYDVNNVKVGRRYER